MIKISFLGAIVIIFTLSLSFQVYAQSIECPALKSGDLFKVPNNSAVYLLDDNLNRMYFPTSDVYHSWYDDFSYVIEIPNICVDSYPTPSQAPYGVNYRPGARLVKVQISPSVYVIEPGNKLRKIGNEDVAKELYGNNWASLVRDIADAYWINYPARGEEMIDSRPHDGMFVKTEGSSDVYYIENGMRKKLDKEPNEDVRVIKEELINKVLLDNSIISVEIVYSKPVQNINILDKNNILAKNVTVNTVEVKDNYYDLLKNEIDEYNKWINQQLAQKRRDDAMIENMKQERHTNCVNKRISSLNGQIYDLQVKKKTEVDKLIARLTTSRQGFIDGIASDYDQQIHELENDKYTAEGFCYLAELSNSSSYLPSFSLNSYEKELQEMESGLNRIMLDYNALGAGITIKRDMSNRITNITSNDGYGFTFKYW